MDELKDIFSGFDPELSSGPEFMERLKRNMDAVDLVRSHNAAIRRRSRKAVAIAAVCGFFAGVLLTLALPVAMEWIATLRFSIPHLGIEAARTGCRIIMWMVIAVVPVLIAINAYDFAMVHLGHRRSVS